VHYWSRIERQCTSRQTDSDGRIAQAWHAGPNHATIPLESVLQCPVYLDELHDSSTPLSRPKLSLGEQVRIELLKRRDEQNDDFIELPRPDQVDSEEWMYLTDADIHERGSTTVTPPQESSSLKDDVEGRDTAYPHPKAPNNTTPSEDAADTSTKPLDGILDGFQSFMTSESGVEGISSRAIEKEQQSHGTNNEINPAAFLNLLHQTLKAESAEELSGFLSSLAPNVKTRDPFFSEERSYGR
jgi:hypothetical protein